jgi:hypothetical protein
VYIAGYEYDGDNSKPCYWLNGVKHSFPGSQDRAMAIALRPNP